MSKIFIEEWYHKNWVTRQDFQDNNEGLAFAKAHAKSYASKGCLIRLVRPDPQPAVSVIQVFEPADNFVQHTQVHVMCPDPASKTPCYIRVTFNEDTHFNMTGETAQELHKQLTLKIHDLRID